MILYESYPDSKFGWCIAIGRKDVGVFGFHVDYYDAPIYSFNLFVFSVSYWGWLPRAFDKAFALCGKDIWWRKD
jgi:hypothetical protein